MSETPIKHFLIKYDIEAGHATVRPFGTKYSAALEAYSKAEESNKDNPNLDIVLVGAESLDVIKRTHSSYFDTRDEFDTLVEGILS